MGITECKQGTNACAHVLGNENRHAELFGQLLEPRRDVDGVADGGELAALRRADVAQHDGPCVHADPDPDRRLSPSRPGGVQAVLRLLDTYGNTKVVANPHVAALDNQKATIKSGQRVPINQQTLVGGTTNAVTTTSQYIDTGVLLQVTPHINAGGLVTLDVQAEVSNPGTAARVGDAPPINTRSVQTMVAVPNGQTMVMGGLISDTSQFDTDGFPMLSRIPVLGGLFGNQSIKKNRNVLVLFVTPRVMDTEFDVRSVIDDMRRRMERLDKAFPPDPGLVNAPTLVIPAVPVPSFPPIVPVVPPDAGGVVAPR